MLQSVKTQKKKKTQKLQNPHQGNSHPDHSCVSFAKCWLAYVFQDLRNAS